MTVAACQASVLDWSYSIYGGLIDDSTDGGREM